MTNTRSCPTPVDTNPSRRRHFLREREKNKFRTELHWDGKERERERTSSRKLRTKNENKKHTTTTTTQTINAKLRSISESILFYFPLFAVEELEGGIEQFLNHCCGVRNRRKFASAEEWEGFASKLRGDAKLNCIIAFVHVNGLVEQLQTRNRLAAEDYSVGIFPRRANKHLRANFTRILLCKCHRRIIMVSIQIEKPLQAVDVAEEILLPVLYNSWTRQTSRGTTRNYAHIHLIRSQPQLNAWANSRPLKRPPRKITYVAFIHPNAYIYYIIYLTDVMAIS